jgi:hypothetical protein
MSNLNTTYINDLMSELAECIHATEQASKGSFNSEEAGRMTAKFLALSLKASVILEQLEIDAKKRKNEVQKLEAEVFIQAANAAGCETRKVGDAVPSGGGSWPVVVDLREDRKGRGFVDPANVLAVGTDVQSLATAINRGWSWAEVYAASPVDAETAVCIDSAVGEVIRRYAKQEMGKSTICSTPWTIEQTKALVRDFCASVDIELPKVRIRNFSTSRKEAVEALLAVLVGQPDFQVVSAGRQNENTGVVVDDTSAWIDRDRLREALVDRKANHVTDAAIEEVLRDNDLLLDQPRLTGGVGWLTKIDWFKSATSSHRAKIAAIT